MKTNKTPNLLIATLSALPGDLRGGTIVPIIGIGERLGGH